MSKPGRNDPCPCGSGKKYKNCCMNKQEPKKTFTPSGKRKFKAKVIDSSLASEAIFAKSGASAPTAEGNPEVLQALRFRMSNHDYRPDESEEKKEIQKPTESAPKTLPKTPFNPGAEFKIASENFQVEEK